VTKTDATKLLRRMYREIRRGKIKFTIKYRPGIAGWWKPDCAGSGSGEYEIELNPREELLPTVLHEMLHHIFSEVRHRKIEQMEAQMVKLLSDQQMRNLLKRVGEVV
jgi:hypothetical protein